MTSTQEQAQEAAAQAKDKAGEAAQQARGRVRDQLDQRSTTAGERVTTQAHDVRSVADALREKGQDQPAKLADQAADRVERLGNYLQDADSDKLLHDLEDLGRRQPMALAFGGLALGFMASRFLKASSQQRYETRGSTPQSRPALPRSTPRTYGTTPGTTETYGGTSTGPGVGVGTGTGTSFPDPVVGTERTTPSPAGGF